MGQRNTEVEFEYEFAVTLGFKLTLHISRESIKRANCILLTKTDGKILIGDKFGDVYRYILCSILHIQHILTPPSFTRSDENSKEALIMGHVSMLTDMVRFLPLGE